MTTQLLCRGNSMRRVEIANSCAHCEIVELKKTIDAVNETNAQLLDVIERAAEAKSLAAAKKILQAAP